MLIGLNLGALNLNSVLLRLIQVTDWKVIIWLGNNAVKIQSTVVLFVLN